MQLRYYQKDALNALYKYFEEKEGNPILAMPTGTGKSVVIAEWCRYTMQRFPGTRIMVLTHVKELILQNFDKMLNLWPSAPAGIYCSGLGRRDTTFPLTFASIHSVYKRPELFGHVHMILIDECHLVSGYEDSKYSTFMDGLKKVNPKLKVIGLSATPYRSGIGLLTEGTIFSHLAYDGSSRENFVKLMEEGFLAPLIPRQTEEVMDMEGIRVTKGDYHQPSMREKFSTSTSNHRALKEAIHLAADRNHWLVFTTGILHAENVADQLNKIGVPAAAIHSKLKTPVRDKYINDFKNGQIRALVNADVLTTGFDFPALDCIVMLRPTQSAGLWVQMLGRGTRPCEGKENCLVLDFAGNTRRLGPINDPVLPRKRNSKGGGEPPIKICEVCFTFNHSTVRNCIQCGFEFPLSQTPLQAHASTLALVADNKEALILEHFDVNMVNFTKHRKLGRPDSVRVTYWCGIRRFTQYLCFEHGGIATNKAIEWWRKLSLDIPPPRTTEEALANLEKIKRPSRILVWVKNPHSEVRDVWPEQNIGDTLCPKHLSHSMETAKKSSESPQRLS